jgi:WD40 repeat protein
MKTTSFVLRVFVAVLACLTPARVARSAGTPDILWMGGGHYEIDYALMSPDQQTLASCSFEDHTVKLWRASDGMLTRTLTPYISGVWSIAMTHDGRFLTSGGEWVPGYNDPPVKLWRVSDGSFVRSFPGGDGTIWSLAFSPSDSFLAGAVDGKIKLWRVADGKLVRTFTGHTNYVFSVAFSPDGATIASGSGDHTIKLWNVATGALIRTLTGHTREVSSVAFSPDGARLASGSWDRTVRYWQVSSGVLLRTIAAHAELISAVAYAPDAQSVASGSWDNTIKLWRTSDGTLIRTITQSGMEAVNTVNFSRDGLSLVTGDIGSGSVRLFRVADGMQTLSCGHHAFAIAGVAYSPTQDIFASASWDKTAKLWAASTGSELRTLIGHTDIINAIAFTPDGITVATAAGSPPPDTRDPTVRLWDVATGDLLFILPGHSGGSFCVAASPDDSTIASGGNDGLVKIWRVRNGTLLRSMNGNGTQVYSVSYSPDGGMLAAGDGEGSVHEWDPATGAEIRVMDTGAPAGAVAYSPDGALIAVGTEQYGDNVLLFDAATGALVATFPGHDAFCQSVAFSPDGTMLASASGYTFDIKFWHVPDGALLATYDRETGWGQYPILPLAFSPDGSRFGYGRSDATVVMAQNAFITAVASAPSRGTSRASLALAPSPVLDHTTFAFTLPRAAAHVTLTVYDVAGRAVREIRAGHLAAGAHALRWNARGADGAHVAAGAYVCELAVDGRPLARRRLVVLP